MWIKCLLVLGISSYLQSKAALDKKPRLEEVEVLGGSVVRLPCDLSPPEDGDSVALVIWYKDDDKTPIYSLDVRDRDLRKGIHWADGDLEGRAQFSSDYFQAELTLEDSRGSDSGLYKCRVDFKHSPTRNSLVNVTVVVPPVDVHLEDADGHLITSRTLEALPEGSSLRITCVSSGGVPSPRLSWWYNLTLLDDSYEVLEDGRVLNSLVLEKLERDQLHGVLTCRALNSPFAVPKTVSATIDVYLAPLDVRLLGENLPVGAGSEYEVACQTSGSRPAATLTWWKSGVPLYLPVREASIEGNVTTSIIRLRTSKADHGASLSCRAANPNLPDRALEASWTLDVHFAPEVEVVLVSPGHADHGDSDPESASVTEGAAVSLLCRVQASPSVTSLTWTLNGKPLLSAGALNYSLHIPAVSGADAGNYCCEARNSEGASVSRSWRLDVKFVPRCAFPETRLYGASRLEEVNVTCETFGNPPATRFRWHLNTSGETFYTNGSDGYSTTQVSISGEDDGVVLVCWAENEVGNQSTPCAFRVVVANSPMAPENCSVWERGETWVRVSCEEGGDGGLPQIYVASVSQGARLVANTSSWAAQFTVTGLEPGVAYSMAVRAVNSRGSSESVVLLASTAGQLLTQRHSTRSESSHGLTDSTVIMGLLSFASCILSAGLLVCTVLACRKYRRPPPGATTSADRKKREQITAVDSCTLSDDERNPDVVPSSNESTGAGLTMDFVGVAEYSPLWETQLVVNSVPTHLVNLQTVPCLQSWGVVDWENTCPQRHAETQTVLESVV